MSKLHYFNITYLCDSNCKFCAANIGIISHEGYTMLPKTFLEELCNSDVKKGDRVIISGGEPTLSPFFWQILDICRRLECYIDLTTNGHFFSDIENVNRILHYEPITIRIPIFGFEDRHDYLTGYRGGYKKVIQALNNFSKISLNSNIVINVKFLLCKATVSSNSEVFEYLYKKFGHLFEYTLSPLLISKKATIYKSELLAPYSELIAQSIDFVENENINCDIIPLCLLSERKRNYILNRKIVKFKKIYNDAHMHIDQMDNYNCSACDNCKMNLYCDKFLPSYIDYFGSDEIISL